MHVHSRRQFGWLFQIIPLLLLLPALQPCYLPVHFPIFHFSLVINGISYHWPLCEVSFALSLASPQLCILSPFCPLVPLIPLLTNLLLSFLLMPLLSSFFWLVCSITSFKDVYLSYSHLPSILPTDLLISGEPFPSQIGPHRSCIFVSILWVNLFKN